MELKSIRLEQAQIKITREGLFSKLETLTDGMKKKVDKASKRFESKYLCYRGT